MAPNTGTTKPIKPLGTTVPSTKRTLAAKDLHGLTVSLNYKACNWLKTPSGAVWMNHDNPTYTVPAEGEISDEDLQIIFKKLRARHLVLGPKPKEQFEKQPDVLQRYLGYLRDRLTPMDTIKNVIGKIVTGPSMVGGYSKIELIELMLAAEMRNPVTRTGGLGRQEVIEELQRAKTYIEQNYGGISAVTSETGATVEIEPSTSGRHMDRGGRADVKAILDLD